jgi:O-antigen/teichoic acid export membrane protein
MNFIYTYFFRLYYSNLSKIIDNIGWLFLDRILRIGVGFFFVTYIARYLGPEQFGLLSFAITFCGFFGVIAGLGLQNIVVRDILSYPRTRLVTLGSAAFLQLISSLVSYFFMLLIIFHIRPDETLAHVIVCILGLAIFLKASEIAIFWFESQVQSKYNVWVQNVLFIIFIAIKLILILQQAPLVIFAWAILAESSLVGFILLIAMNKLGPSLLRLSVSKKCVKTLVKDSWPVAISSIAIMVYMKIDHVMLGQMIGDEAVGIYSVAVRISELWYFIPIIITSSVMPLILKSKKLNEKQYYKRLQKLYDLMAFISITISLFVTFLAEPIVDLLFGANYISAAKVLKTHIWASVFVFLGVASHVWYIAENRLKTALLLTICGAVVNVILNFLLIPKIGVFGSAISLVISQIVSCWFCEGIIKSTRRVFWMKLNAMNIIRWPYLLFLLFRSKT